MRYTDRTTGNQGRTEEWRRIRQVRFDSHLIRQLYRARLDRPCAGGLIGFNCTASTGHIDHGHADVRQTRGLFSCVRQSQSTGQFGTNQQQAGDELGGTGRIDTDPSLSSRKLGWRCNGKRQSSDFPVVFDLGTKLLQTVKHRPHRAGVGLFVTVEMHWPIGEQCQSRYKTHHRTGQAAEHINVAIESAG